MASEAEWLRSKRVQAHQRKYTAIPAPKVKTPDGNETRMERIKARLLARKPPA